MQPGDNPSACNTRVTSGDSSVWRLRPNNTKKDDGTSDGDELGTSDGALEKMEYKEG
jgi:hypothetical protein